MRHTSEHPLNKSFLIRALLIAFLIFIAAHAFCYFNLSLRGDSLMLNAEKTNNSAISQGQFLRPFYWRVRGNIISPLLVGLLSFFFLFASLVCIAALLGLTGTVPFAVLSCIVFLNPALLEQNVSTLYTSDALCLAFFCMTAGASVLLRPDLFPMHHLLTLCAGFILLFCGLGLAPELSSCAFCIILVYVLSLYLGSRLSDDPTALRGAVIRTLLVQFAALAAFLFGAFFFCRRSGNDLNISLMPLVLGSFPETLLMPLRAMTTPITIYPHLFPVIRIILPLAALLSLSLRKKLPALLALPVLFLLLTVPVICFSVPQFPLPFLFLDVTLLLFIVQTDVTASFTKVLRYVLRGAYLMLFLGSLIFFNHAYLKVNLDFDTSLVLMTQIISRLEDRTDFRPAATQIAFVGSLADSPLVADREGFEHLSALRALRERTSLTDRSQLTWYFWETLGYPLNCLSDYDQDQIALLPEVADIPVFPAADSIQRINDTLVIRLSD